MGTGDYRSSALIIQNGDGSESCDLRYLSHEIRKGKYELEGLPAVYAKEEEAETLEILLQDRVSKVEVRLLYGVLEKEDIITRSAKVLNQEKTESLLRRRQAPVWILLQESMICLAFMEDMLWNGIFKEAGYFMEVM